MTFERDIIFVSARRKLLPIKLCHNSWQSALIQMCPLICYYTVRHKKCGTFVYIFANY